MRFITFSLVLQVITSTPFVLCARVEYHLSRWRDIPFFAQLLSCQLLYNLSWLLLHFKSLAPFPSVCVPRALHNVYIMGWQGGGGRMLTSLK